MKTVGLAHIVAVSGAHLVLVTGFAVVILQVLGVPRRVCIPVQLGIVISYACLTALPVSVLRAAVMSFCALASFYAKRASASVNALAICVVGIISVNPSWRFPYPLCFRPVHRWGSCSFRKGYRSSFRLLRQGSPGLSPIRFRCAFRLTSSPCPFPFRSSGRFRLSLRFPICLPLPCFPSLCAMGSDRLSCRSPYLPYRSFCCFP